ncbi:unnamed protein product [Chrysodeixis includens]|uniref:GST C-terminal domain-containing protein n=1 Tax=Chrysodeixis includens TaxID=689277 RepID=A0A9N8KX71_CHRIL|nr:unnamed protein product [Chrysodeixis includens]
MAIDLYRNDVSASCTTVQLVAAALGLKLNLINMDVHGTDHLKPEFLKIPQVMGAPADPALQKKLEEAFGVLDALLEGNTYAVGDHLTIADLSLVSTVTYLDAAHISLKEYPNLMKFKMPIDLYRSPTSAPCVTVQLVAAALDLELNLIDLNVYGGDHLKPEFLKFPQFMGGKADEALGKKLEEAFGVLDAFLEGNAYAVGDHLTIADLCLVSTIASIEVFDFSFKEYPNISKWYGLVKSSAPQCEELLEKMATTLKGLIAAQKAKQES